MDSREIVRRAIEFQKPPRLPFFQHQVQGIPDDVCDCWEMDRARRGWFFDHCAEDDWGCGWAVTDQHNMGQVVSNPLADWDKLATYRPPDPRDPYYFERLEQEMSKAGDRYVVVTCHFTLMERLHMLRGFSNALLDLYLEPAKVERVLDMILEWKIALMDDLHRRFGDRVNGLFMTDDWGSQHGPFISPTMFEVFFLHRYRQLVGAVHSHGWHAILHSCGRVNDLVPSFIEAGFDGRTYRSSLNLQQPRLYGIAEIGHRFAGQVCFLTTADIQATLPSGDAERVRAEVDELIRCWSTPDGGFIVFNYGDPRALGVQPEMTEVMFHAFAERMGYWGRQGAPTAHTSG